FYIAYELIEGVTLEEAMKSGREFSPDEVTDIIIQAAEALGYAHEQGVVHRDISPGNLFLSPDGKVRISDFGVAKVASRTTITPGSEAIVGTPGYMAPEQVKGGSETDPRSDIFSLGCVAYEMLAREPAFSGDSIAQVIHRVISVQPPPIREKNPKVPFQLEQLVFRMLAKNPDYRYQSMSDVRIAAESALETLPRVSERKTSDEIEREPVLVAIAGPHEGEKFKLLPSVTTIGRTLGDVLLGGDPKVESQHAWITREETGWVLYDADSEEGTFLNGEKIEREEILPGDKIQIGDCLLEFRGAGGHAGVFGEPAEIVKTDDKKQAGKPRRVSKTQILVVLLLVVPSLIIVIAVVYFGIVIPAGYMSKLDAATNPRWVEAFSKLDEIPVSDPAWSQNAREVLDSWQASRIGSADDYKAPGRVYKSGRFNSEVVYRFTLLRLAQDFLVIAGLSGNEIASIPTQAVSAIEIQVDNLQPPSGVASVWQGRKHQLLALIRNWKTLRIISGGEQISSSTTAGFSAERDQAKQYLRSGWFIFREAGTDFSLLSQAFDQFQRSRQALVPVLETNPSDQDAKTVSGIAAFLAAKTLRQVASRGDIERLQRALDILD
ncbi:MAG TPA: FHA domain-containing protein, partial [Firmicutes bacterium]|nr:FHA domain-containing protein [Bacillota bacterium]